MKRQTSTGLLILLAGLALQSGLALGGDVLSRSTTVQQLGSPASSSLTALSRSATMQNLPPSLPPSAPAISRAFTISKDGGTTDVPLPSGRTPPLAFVLHPASPNPVHRTARLEYELADPRPVRLELIDASGRRIRTLVQAGLQPPGRYVVSWDGTGGDGAQVPAGVYWLRMQAGNFDQTRKVVLLRD